TFEAPELVDDLPPESEPAWPTGTLAEDTPTRAEPIPEPPAVAAPRPKPRPRARPNRVAGADSPAAPGAEGKESGSENAGFGAEGTAPGLRDLLLSFVRAIPSVASSDPAWATIPIGPAGSAELTLVLDG